MNNKSEEPSGASVIEKPEQAEEKEEMKSNGFLARATERMN